MASAGSAPPIVSVILAVRNEEAHLPQVLGDLAHQTLPKDQFEVIVVDGMSTDRTVEVARQFASQFPIFQLRENSRQLASAARNIGIVSAQGEYIIFIDGHCQIESETMLADMLELFRQTGADVLCRPQPLTAEPMTPFQRAAGIARASALGHGADSTIYSNFEGEVTAASSGAAYRSQVFKKVGSFDERFDACEDVELNTRVDLSGLKAHISPRLTVRYVARKSVDALWKQLFRYGVGRFRLLAKHPTTASPGTFVPPALAASILLLIFWWLLYTPLAIVLSVLVGLYILIVIVFSAVLSIKHGPDLFPKLLVIFPTIHLALGFGFLAGPFAMLKR
jgi:succinoglycan biosynthesis protein ExoA